jgi:hypothetical protein
MHGLGQPGHFLSGQKPERKPLPGRLSRPAGRFDCGIYLDQRQPSVIEKSPARIGQFHAVNAAAQQLRPDLVLQIPDLSTQ